MKTFSVTAMFVFILLSGSEHVCSQSTEPVFEFKNYSWSKNPELHTLTVQEAKENEIILKDMRLIEYVYEGKQQNLMQYITRHRIIKLNSDKAIEKNNKVYIGMADILELTDLKARFISKSGKITVLDKKDVKFIENYENLGPFNIFAMTGIEIGGEVEYVYTTKQYASYFGTEKFQSNETRKNSEITLLAPTNLFFESKSYNGFPELKKDSLPDERNRLCAKADNIPAMKEEKYSAYGASLMRVEYKLAYNTVKGLDKRLLTWNDAAERFFQNVISVKPKEQSRAADLFKTLKLNKSRNDEEKIRKIESYVKTNIAMKEEAAADFSDIEKIVKNKYANHTGMTRLLIALYNEAGIETQLVLTCDRKEARFDGNFDTWNYLDKYLLYFPSVDNFITPTDIFCRLGFVPDELICNTGLFIKTVTIGDFSTAVSSVKDIPCNDYKQSFDNIYSDVKFDAEDISRVNIHIRREINGYSALSIQPVYSFLNDEQKKEVNDELCKVISKDDKISNLKISNYDEASVLQKPLLIEADVNNGNLMEKAGNKYLFKAGLLIGPQVELYQEGERKSDIVNEFNRMYYRELLIDIPKGYKITNPEVLNFNVSDEENGSKIMEFKASYLMEGNKLKIMIDENYRKTDITVSKFEAFKNVINAAADFNKVVLFFEKN